MDTAPGAIARSGPANDEAGPTNLPRVTIQFCTQCKWMLRAAYYAQELLSTFSTALGEVALQPSTGGTFIVGIAYMPPSPQSSSAPMTTRSGSDDTAGVSSDPPLDVQTETPLLPSTQQPVSIQHKVLWDRKVDGGFPETKELKRRVRDVIEPERNLGHVDREYPKGSAAASKEADATKGKGEVVDSRNSNTTKVQASEGGQREGCEDCK